MGIGSFSGFIGGGVDDYFAWPLVSYPGVETAMTGYSTTVITDLALDYIASHDATSAPAPWFVQVAYNAAHSPFQVPPAELHSVELGALLPGDKSTSVLIYHAMLEAMDTKIGRLLSAVDLTETVVIYIGDNGTPSQVKDGTSPVRGSKISTHEGGIWVPLVMAGAEVARAGEREAAPVSAVDLHATILALAGAGIAKVGDSYSLTPLLAADPPSGVRSYAFSEHCSSFFGNHIAVRNAQFKLLRSSGQWGLFDLLGDPGETVNLYANPAFAEVRADLETELARLEQEATTGCF